LDKERTMAMMQIFVVAEFVKKEAHLVVMKLLKE
jgi:hypothetical protein